jgi:hypothetical protein
LYEAVFLQVFAEDAPDDRHSAGWQEPEQFSDIEEKLAIILESLKDRGGWPCILDVPGLILFIKE